MKKINGFLLGLTVAFASVATVHAAGSATLSCKDTKIVPGGSTNCTISATSDEAVNSFIASVETSEYLTISNERTNTGWNVLQGYPQQSTNKKSILYGFTSSTAIPANTKFEPFAFTLTLEEAAKNLPQTEDCGQICLSAVAVNDSTRLTVSNSGCYTPEIDLTCKENCNPETGSFVNYAVLGSSALIALVAIGVVTNKKKFYQL